MRPPCLSSLTPPPSWPLNHLHTPLLPHLHPNLPQHLLNPNPNPTHQGEELLIESLMRFIHPDEHRRLASMFEGIVFTAPSSLVEYSQVFRVR